MHDDFAVVGLFTVASVSSSIGGLSRLVVGFRYSRRMEGGICNRYRKFDDINNYSACTARVDNNTLNFV